MWTKWLLVRIQRANKIHRCLQPRRTNGATFQEDFFSSWDRSRKQHHFKYGINRKFCRVRTKDKYYFLDDFKTRCDCGRDVLRPRLGHRKWHSMTIGTIHIWAAVSGYSKWQTLVCTWYSKFCIKNVLKHLSSISFIALHNTHKNNEHCLM